MLTETAVIALIVYCLSNIVRQENYCTLATNKTAIRHFIIIILCEYLISLLLLLLLLLMHLISRQK
jgi:hypothetical protein